MRDGLSFEEWRGRRNTVINRDGNECQDCGSEKGPFHVHHMRPLHEGGSSDISNLTTLCGPCHNERHAEERRKGTLEDIRSIFEAVEAPVLRTKEIANRIDNPSHAASSKLKKLVDSGFLKKGSRGVYYRSDIDPQSMNLAGSEGIVVDGIYVENGELVGHENMTIQCDACDRWLYSKNPERRLKKHQNKYCE